MYQIQSRPIINFKHCQSMYNREVNFIENRSFSHSDSESELPLITMTITFNR